MITAMKWWCALLVMASLPACGATVEMRAGAEALAPAVSTIVALPVAIGWDGGGGVVRAERAETAEADLQAHVRH